MWRTENTRRGEDAPNAKLNRNLIQKCRERRAEGATLRELAEDARVSIECIRRALNGDSYSEG